MILATLLTWTLLGQNTGGFSGPSQAGQESGATLVYPSLGGGLAGPGGVFVPRLSTIQHGEPALPGSRLDPAEAARRAHTIVVAEVTAGAPVDAGGAGLDWCDLKVATALKGDAAAVDGKRLGCASGPGKLAPTVGQPYLVAIGRDQGRDVILDVKPATVATIQAATRAEDNRRAIQAGAARRVPGGKLSIAEAAAKAHTIVVSEVLNCAEVGAGGVSGAACLFKVTSTLKGAARPGDQVGAGYTPSDPGIAPQIGESFLVFIGKADKQDIDVAVKLLPATPTDIQAVQEATAVPEGRLLPGPSLTIAEAGAKAHTVIVATVNNMWMVGAGTVVRVSCSFDASATLKGDARPYARRLVGWFSSGGGVAPQKGESFVVWIGDDRGCDSILKMTPATAANIRAARDQLQAAGPPVAAR